MCDVGVKYITSQVELKIKLLVTCVDVKLNNQPDVLPKSSCYHPLLMNNLDLHATWQTIGYIFSSSNFYLNQVSSLKILFRIISIMMWFMLKSVCVLLKWSWLISSSSPFYDLDILFWCFDHIENVDESLASEPSSIYKSKFFFFLIFISEISLDTPGLYLWHLHASDFTSFSLITCW